MSPIAIKLLSLAYEHYEKTSDKTFSYQFKNADDMIQSVTGADQLYEDGYIDNVSDNVTSSHVSIVPVTPITFDITDAGIEYMRFHRES